MRRETRDGCNPCPGPFGGPRNRTSEGASGSAPAKNKGGQQQRNQANPVQSAAPVNNNRPGTFLKLRPLSDKPVSSVHILS